MPCNMWGEITNPFPNFNGSTVIRTMHKNNMLSFLQINVKHVNKHAALGLSCNNTDELDKLS